MPRRCLLDGRLVGLAISVLVHKPHVLRTEDLTARRRLRQTPGDLPMILGQSRLLIRLDDAVGSFFLLFLLACNYLAVVGQLDS